METMLCYWQEVVVGLLFLLCLGLAGRYMYRQLLDVGKNNNPCAHCATGCDLKRIMEQKQQTCAAKGKKTEKK